MNRHPEKDGEAKAGATLGEESMSIEETNKLRASLGLAPLKINTNDTTDSNKKRKREMQEKSSEKDVAKLEERVQAARERRRQQELLSKTKTLGEHDAEIDDVMAWVNRSRAIDSVVNDGNQSKKLRQSTSIPPAKIGDKTTETTELPSHLKVKMALDDLEAGEEMILTLEDRGILNEKGLLNDAEGDDAEGDTLENITGRENRRREKAVRESRKSATPLWEEDGVKRPLLHKYDEEEEEQALGLNDINSAQMKTEREKSIREKLTAGFEKATGLVPCPDGSQYTAEELETMRIPKKKKERKLKKKVLTAEDIAEMEATAAVTGASDLGSREERERRAIAKAEEIANLESQQRSKFETAVQKANLASETLRERLIVRSSKTAMNRRQEENEEDEEDEELVRSLAKARQLAQNAAGDKAEGKDEYGMNTVVMMQLAQRRKEALERQSRQSDPMQSQLGLTFTDIGELTRAITVQQPVNESAMDDVQQNKQVEEEMKEEHEDVIPMALEENVVEEEERQEEEKEVEEQKPRKQARSLRTPSTATMMSTVKQATEPAQNSSVSEKAIGTGLGGALAFLKERGELDRTVEWAGRTKDSRDAYFTKAMSGYKDVFTGGKTDDRLALDVEVALTRKDEHGRILTPKEAFRQLCHQFHGVKPSKNTQEKRAKQIRKELAQRQVATGAKESDMVEGLKAVQAVAAAPYVALSGTIRPGQSRDAASGYATADRAEFGRRAKGERVQGVSKP